MTIHGEFIMKVICPTCNQRVEIEENLSGAQVNCPSCKQPFVTPTRRKFVSQAEQIDPREAWIARFRKIFLITVIIAVALIPIAFYFKEHLPPVLVSWLWVITLCIIAFIFLIAEAFVPGPMVCATISGICLLIAVGICYFRISALMSIFLLLGIAPLFIGAIYWIVNHLHIFFGDGGSLSKGGSLEHDEKVTACSSLIGSFGTVFTPLQPHGTVIVAGAKWDAVASLGEFITMGTEIEVIGVDEASFPRLKVRKKETEGVEQSN